MTENKYNLYELQKKIPYNTVAPILTAWDEQSDNVITDLARMAYDAGRNSILNEKNKMEQVAALFGKRLGEEFTIKRSFGFDFEGHFSERGFVFWGKDATNNEGWYSDDGRLIWELLTGEAVIINE